MSRQIVGEDLGLEPTRPQEDDPPVEDELVATEDPSGRWTWAVR
jgi:hypothetical protein